jgi:hypothetical protein
LDEFDCYNYSILCEDKIVNVRYLCIFRKCP